MVSERALSFGSLRLCIAAALAALKAGAQRRATDVPARCAGAAVAVVTVGPAVAAGPDYTSPVPKNPSPPFQPSSDFAREGPSTLGEIYAAALMEAERGLRNAQTALSSDDSNESRARYAKALYDYDQLQCVFPFIAAGLAGDAED